MESHLNVTLIMKNIKDDFVRWGIIGVGDVCEVKSAPAMQIIEGSELVAVMRRNGEKAADYAKRHRVPKWYSNADQLINDPKVNAVYIATPPNAHEEFTVKAAQAGKPVYVEKPMARSTSECQSMVNVCAANNVPLYVAYYRRCLPNFEKLRSLIDEKVIGDIRLVKIELYKTLDPDIVADITATMETNWRIDPEVAGGGYFFDLAAHQLDYLDYALGPIKSVNGIASNQGGFYKAADIISSSWIHENGIVGNGSWCFTSSMSSQKDIMTLIGSTGKITISFFGAPQISIERDNQPVEVLNFDLPKHIQQPLIQTVVDDLLGKGKCPSTGESALRTNWAMEQMTRGYYER